MMLNRRQFGVGLASLAALGARPIEAMPKEQRKDWTDLMALVVEERTKAGIPALSAALVSSEGVLSIGVSGTRAWPDGPDIKWNDHWHLGSCTKAFTCTLAARLVEKGLIGWNTTVGQILKLGHDHRWDHVSLISLLCHRSGAPNNFDQALLEEVVHKGGTTRDQRSELVRRGLESAPQYTPNSMTRYSNAGYLIAGAMLEAAADDDWESLVRAEVFLPLGLESAGFGAPGTPGLLDQPLGHVIGENGQWKAVQRGPGDDIPGVGGPAGTIHISLPDWARFATAHLRENSKGNRYLKAESWRRLHNPGSEGWDYAPGWIATKTDRGQAVLTHLGSNNFFVAEASLYPSVDRAILLVTNLGHDAAEPAFRHLREKLEGLFL